ncbi:MAG: NAD-dependent epimerase/dehydratase family protein [Caldilineae bacterium]|nr:MAG: NAD-dependent epimerase/dehydratase family protein [Caldilineae bacterium]
MAHQRVFVTGASDFIGSYLVWRLRERGDRVRCLVSSPEEAALFPNIGARVVVGDINDRPLVREAMKGCDVVFHLAEYFGAGLDEEEAALMEKINIEGAHTVLDVAFNIGIPRIVYASTATIYPCPGNGDPFTQMYPRTKWEAYRQVVEPLLRRGAPIIITMPGNVYGPGDTGIVGRLLERIVTRRLPILLAGDALVPWVYIDDAAQGHILAAEQGRIGEQYPLVDQCLTMRETIQLFQDITGVPGPRLLGGQTSQSLANVASAVLEKVVPLPLVMSAEALRTMPDIHCIVSAEKTRRELHWETKPIEEAFRQTFEYYLER